MDIRDRRENPTAVNREDHDRHPVRRHLRMAARARRLLPVPVAVHPVQRRDLSGTDTSKENWTIARSWLDSGRLRGLIVYCVYRSNWRDVITTHIEMQGENRPDVVSMVDVESWGGQIRSDNSDSINRLVWGLGDWRGPHIDGRPAASSATCCAGPAPHLAGAATDRLRHPVLRCPPGRHRRSAQTDDRTPVHQRRQLGTACRRATERCDAT